MFLTPNCGAFFDYWNSLRGGALLPHTADFLRRPPPELMPYVFIHEITPAGLLVRYMGTGLVDRWQQDLTGSIFGSSMGPKAVQKLAARAKTMHRQPCGLRASGRLMGSAGRDHRYEAVMLPVAANAGRPPRIVTFSQVLEKMHFDEHSRSFVSAEVTDWLDIGAGIPGRAIDESSADGP